MICAIVLAAGKSVRTGRCKQLFRLGGMSLIERVLTNVQRSMVDDVVVVVGFKADAVARKIPQDKKVVVNPNFEEGMGSSLRLGLASVENRADAVIILLVDQPFVDSNIIDALIKRYRDTKAKVVVPTHLKRRGNPVLFDKVLFKEIMKVQGDIGAREIVERHPEEVEEVEIDAPYAFFDIDTIEDLKVARGILRKLHRERDAD